MFYLNELFKISIQRPIVIMMYFISSVLVGSYALNKNYADQLISEKFNIKAAGPYFYALVDGKENISRAQRRLLTLPGVQKVRLMESENIGKKIQGISKKISTEIDLGDFLTKSKGLYISLSENISEKSVDLIKNYLVKLIGQNNIQLGSIIRPKDKIQNLNEMSIYSEYLIYGIVSVLFIIFLFVAYSLSKTVSQVGYLVEKFQRRNNVSIKIILTLQVFIISALLIIRYFLNSGINLNHFALAFGVICLPVLFIGPNRWSYND